MSVVAFCLIVFLQGVSAKHSDDCPHVGDCPQVDAVVENVDLTFDDRLCQDLEDISCNAHHASHDEQICGTDGVTYRDHCHYVKAKCQSMGHTTELNVAFHGACPVFTVMKTTASPVMTTHPVVVTSHQAPIVSTGAAVQQTTTAAPTMTTAAPAMTTTLSVSHIITNVFCQQINYISCTNDMQVVCGSNGNFYPNKCELAKDQCSDPTLTQVDLLLCSPSV